MKTSLMFILMILCIGIVAAAALFFSSSKCKNKIFSYEQTGQKSVRFADPLVSSIYFY